MVASWLVRGAVAVLIASPTAACSDGAAVGRSPTTTVPTPTTENDSVPLSVRQSGDPVVLRFTNPGTADRLFWAYLDVWEDDEMLGRIGFLEGTEEFGFVPGVFTYQNDAAVTVPASSHRDITIPLPVELVGRPLVLTGRDGLRREVLLTPATGRR